MNKFIILLLLCFTACVSAYGQSPEKKKSVDQIVFRLDDGRDSLVNNVIFTGIDSISSWQHQMIYRQGDSLRRLLPEQVSRVKRGNKTYWSQMIETRPGVVERLMVQRSLNGGEGWPSLYKYYDEEDKPQIYVQVQDGVLKRLDPKDPDNVFRHELRRLNAEQGGNAHIDQRLTKLKANRYGLREARALIASQNDNQIPRNRYGVGIGLFGNSTQLTLVEKEGSLSLPRQNQLQMTVTAWADFRSLDGLSFHPELTFQKTSAHVPAVDNHRAEVAFNRTQLCVPLLVRYTCVQLHGPWLPYVEGGVQLYTTMRNECKLQYIMYDNEDYVEGMSISEYSENSSWINPVAGLGVEYRLTPRHSLFFDVRYLLGLEDRIETVLNVKQGGWMASLSINL